MLILCLAWRDKGKCLVAKLKVGLATKLDNVSTKIYAYYNTLKKQGLSFNDIKRICDAMDADLCIEFKKRNSDNIQNEEKAKLEAQIAELQAKLKTM